MMVQDEGPMNTIERNYVQQTREVNPNQIALVRVSPNPEIHADSGPV